MKEIKKKKKLSMHYISIFHTLFSIIINLMLFPPSAADIFGISGNLSRVISVSN